MVGMTAGRRTTPPVLVSVAGSNLPKLGVCVALTRNHDGANAVPDATNVALAQAIGAKVIRLDAFWAAIEGSLGVYNWSSKDGLISAARNAGMTVVLILGYGNTLYGMASATSAPTTQAQITGLANLGVSALNRYGTSNIIYEVWNEQNLVGQWNGSPSASAFSSVFSAVNSAMKAVNPACTVIAGGLGTQGQGPPNDPNTYAAAFSALTTSDGIADHPYNNKPENILADCSSFVASINKPFYITEFGYTVPNIPKKTQAQKGNWLSRGILCALGSGAKTLIVYNLISDSTDPTNVAGSFGMYDFNYNPLAAATQFSAIAALCANCRVMERFRYSEGAHQINFYQNDGSVSCVVWGETITDFGVTLNIGSYSSLSAVDLLGNSVPFATSGQQVTIAIADGMAPVVVTAS